MPFAFRGAACLLRDVGAECTTSSQSRKELNPGYVCVAVRCSIFPLKCFLEQRNAAFLSRRCDWCAGADGEVV